MLDHSRMATRPLQAIGTSLLLALATACAAPTSEDVGEDDGALRSPPSEARGTEADADPALVAKLTTIRTAYEGAVGLAPASIPPSAQAYLERNFDRHQGVQGVYAMPRMDGFAERVYAIEYVAQDVRSLQRALDLDEKVVRVGFFTLRPNMDGPSSWTTWGFAAWPASKAKTDAPRWVTFSREPASVLVEVFRGQARTP